MLSDLDEDELEELQSRLYSQIHHSTAEELPEQNPNYSAAETVNTSQHNEGSTPLKSHRYYSCVANKNKENTNSTIEMSSNGEGNSYYIENLVQNFIHTPNAQSSPKPQDNTSYNAISDIGCISVQPLYSLDPYVTDSVLTGRKARAKKKKLAKDAKRREMNKIAKAANEDAELFRNLSMEDRKKVIKYQKRQRYIKAKKERRKNRRNLEIEQENFANGNYNPLFHGYQGITTPAKFVDGEVISLSGSDGSSCVALNENYELLVVSSEDEHEVQEDIKPIPSTANLEIIHTENKDTINTAEDADVIILEFPEETADVIDLDPAPPVKLPTDSELMKPPSDFETMSVSSVTSLNLSGELKMQSSINSPTKPSHSSREPTPESTSNDFLDNSISIDQSKFNFSLHGTDFNSSKDLSKAKSSGEVYESESSCSASDVSAPIKTVIFNEIEFDSPSKELFSETNLNSFSEYITPRRQSVSIPSLLTPNDEQFERVRTKATVNEKNNSDSSSESEYDDSKAVLMSKNTKKLPNLSHFEEYNRNDSLEQTSTKGNTKKKKRNKVELDVQCSTDVAKKKKRRSVCEGLNENQDQQVNADNTTKSDQEDQGIEEETNKESSNKSEQEVENNCNNEKKKRSNPEQEAQTAEQEPGKERKKKRSKNEETDVDARSKKQDRNDNSLDEGNVQALDKKKTRRKKNIKGDEDAVEGGGKNKKKKKGSSIEEPDDSNEPADTENQGRQKTTKKKRSGSTDDSNQLTQTSISDKEDERSSENGKKKKRQSVRDDYSEKQDKEQVNGEKSGKESKCGSQKGKKKKRSGSDDSNESLDRTKSNNDDCSTDVAKKKKRRSVSEDLNEKQDPVQVNVDNTTKSDEEDQGIGQKVKKKKKSGSACENLNLYADHPTRVQGSTHKSNIENGNSGQKIKKKKSNMHEELQEPVYQTKSDDNSTPKRKKNKRITAEELINQTEITADRSHQPTKRKKNPNLKDDSESDRSKSIAEDSIMSENYDQTALEIADRNVIDGLNTVSNEIVVDVDDSDSDVEIIPEPEQECILVEDTEDSTQGLDIYEIKSIGQSSSDNELSDLEGEDRNLNLVMLNTSNERTKRFADYWTEDMNKFYNTSWGNENLDVQDIQMNMSNDPNKWRISHYDRQHVKSSPRGPRCKRCRQIGHYAGRCDNKPGPPKCSLCGDRGHFEPRCPNKLCTQCGRFGPYSTIFCSKCAHMRSYKCNKCFMNGHKEEYCPDNWRKYHLTTEEGPIVQSTGQLLKPKRDRWCSGCAGSGHLEYECGYYGRSHPPSVPYVMNYTDVYDLPKTKQPDNRQATSTSSTSICNNPNVSITDVQTYGDVYNLQRLPTGEEKFDNNTRQKSNPVIAANSSTVQTAGFSEYFRNDSYRSNSTITSNCNQNIHPSVTNTTSGAINNSPLLVSNPFHSQSPEQLGPTPISTINSLTNPQAPSLHTKVALPLTPKQAEYIAMSKTLLINLEKDFGIPLKVVFNSASNAFIDICGHYKKTTIVYEKIFDYLKQVPRNVKFYESAKTIMNFITSVKQDPRNFYNMMKGAKNGPPYRKLNMILFGQFRLEQGNYHVKALQNFIKSMEVDNLATRKLQTDAGFALCYLYTDRRSIRTYKRLIETLNLDEKSLTIPNSETDMQNCNVTIPNSQTDKQNCNVTIPNSQTDKQNCNVTIPNSQTDKQNCNVTSPNTQTDKQNCIVTNPFSQTDCIEQNTEFTELPDGTAEIICNIPKKRSRHFLDVERGVEFLDCLKKLYAVSIECKVVKYTKSYIEIKGVHSAAWNVHDLLNRYLYNLLSLDIFRNLKSGPIVYQVRNKINMLQTLDHTNYRDCYKSIIKLENSPTSDKTNRLLSKYYVRLHATLFGHYKLLDGSKHLNAIYTWLFQHGYCEKSSLLSHNAVNKVMNSYLYIFDNNRKNIDYETLLNSIHQEEN